MSGIYLTARFGDSLGAFSGLRIGFTHNEDLLKCKDAKYSQHKEQTHGGKLAGNHTQASGSPVPVESQMTCLISPAPIVTTWLSGKLTRDSVIKIFIGA